MEITQNLNLSARHRRRADPGFTIDSCWPELTWLRLGTHTLKRCRSEGTNRIQHGLQRAGRRTLAVVTRSRLSIEA
jgi:hypothetical protein